MITIIDIETNILFFRIMNILTLIHNGMVIKLVGDFQRNQEAGDERFVYWFREGETHRKLLNSLEGQSIKVTIDIEHGGSYRRTAYIERVNSEHASFNLFNVF